MTTRIVAFEISSFWHAGTGKGAGTVLDASVFRSAGGLPVLPGRTVRGLLREALDQAQRLGAVDGQPFDGSAAKWCFGTPLESAPGGGERVRKLEEARFATEEGRLEVDSAVLGEDEERSRQWEAWAASPESKGKLEQLFRPFAAPKIAKDGTAESGTLRAIEVTVPLTLYARVTGPDDGPRWWEALREALPLVRGLGSHRNRGLGRVEATLLEERR